MHNENQFKFASLQLRDSECEVKCKDIYFEKDHLFLFCYFVHYLSSIVGGRSDFIGVYM